MRNIFKIVLGALALGALLPLATTAQTKSAKRGLCWDENKQSLSNGPIEKMLPGVSWVYNWGVCPAKEVSLLNSPDGMDYYPMC